MPLSEHEENVLAEIERQLAAEDPRFAARARRRPRTLGRRARLRAAILGAVVGVLLVAMLALLPSPWNFVAGGTGLLLLLGAIVLAAGVLAADRDNEQVAVRPEERG